MTTIAAHLTLLLVEAGLSAIDLAHTFCDAQGVPEDDRPRLTALERRLERALVWCWRRTR